MRKGVLSLERRRTASSWLGRGPMTLDSAGGGCERVKRGWWFMVIGV
jgi:hypothetical protein